MNRERSFHVDETLSASWDQRLAVDLASEVEHFSFDRRCTIPELRTFFAIKCYRDLLARLTTAREGKTSFDALRSVAREMRQYALERPALWAAGSRTSTSDCAEWRASHGELCDLIKSVLAECGVHGQHAEDALDMLRSLVRGFAVHQILGSFLDVYSYDESFERVVEIYVAGVGSIGAAAARARRRLRRPCAPRSRPTP
ncbi:TetR-like C-terminal domain-containing protein [Bradyrhizobium sp. BR 1433]|uniref:TetR-like C-terminal domain-containing protein n=1 Tax=Bradyrhizobium sp. BR 1433 TaxID=3447967 RepID=UPI003EE65DDC